MSSGAIDIPYASVPYTTVEARAVDFLADPDGSTSSGGEQTGAFWLYWDSAGGFTGKSWLWGEAYSHLETGWANSGLTEQYGKGYNGFLNYMNTNPENLNIILGAWPPADKAAFVGMQQDYLGIYGGVYGENAGNECIEYRG